MKKPTKIRNKQKKSAFCERYEYIDTVYKWRLIYDY